MSIGSLCVAAFTQGTLYAVLAIAFGLSWQVLRVFHVAFGAVYLASAYLVVDLANRYDISAFCALAIGSASGLVLGWLNERLLYRPLLQRHASPLAGMIGSLAAFMLVQQSLALAFGNDLRIVHPAKVARVQAVSGHFSFVATLTVLAITLAALVIAEYRLRWTQILQAIGDDLQLTQILAVRVFRHRTLAMMLSGALTSAVGAILSLNHGIHPEHGLRFLLIAAIAVFLGGAATFRGWVVGGFLFAVMETAALWYAASGWLDIIIPLCFLALLLILRRGIVTRQMRRDEP